MLRWLSLCVCCVIVFSLTACELGNQTAEAPTTVPAPNPISVAPAPTATRTALNVATPTTSAAAPTTSSAASTTKPTAPDTGGDLVRVVFVAGKNEARYRVREQLVGVSLPSDAIGATKDVSGTIVARMDGTVLSEQSKIVVDLRTLRSDDNRRDNFLRMSTLGTNRFPFVTFVVKEAKGLVAPPKQGPTEFKLVGDLTVRDVTRSVTWDVKGTIAGDEATGQAKTSFTFADFKLEQPRVPMVLSVEDTIKLEIDLQLRRASN